jgi:hypothetical protein
VLFEAKTVRRSARKAQAIVDLTQSVVQIKRKENLSNTTNLQGVMAYAY